jgi:hypothetical protein
MESLRFGYYYYFAVVQQHATKKEVAMSKISLVLLKGSVIATVVALTLSAFSATSVFAAGSTTTAPSTQVITTNLESNWKAEASTLQAETLVLDQFDRMMDNQTGTYRDERFTSLAYRNFSVALTKANKIASTHAGFNAKGMVTNQVQAAKSVDQLNWYLSELRGVLGRRLNNI